MQHIVLIILVKMMKMPYKGDADLAVFKVSEALPRCERKAHRISWKCHKAVSAIHPGYSAGIDCRHHCLLVSQLVLQGLFLRLYA